MSRERILGLVLVTALWASTTAAIASSSGPSDSGFCTLQVACEKWVARYEGTGSDEANAMATSPDGAKVYVTGVFQPGLSGDYLTAAYDAFTGRELWVSKYDGPDRSSDTASSIVVSPSGNRIYVTGASWGSLTQRDYATVAYDATTGERLWVTRYNLFGNSDDFADSITVNPDGGRVYVTGTSNGDFATIAYDSVTGAELWVARYNGPPDGYEQAFALAASPDGTRLYVTGTGGGDFATVVYDSATGGRLWLATYNGPGNSSDVAMSLVSSPDGSFVYVTGSSWGGATNDDYATVAYDAVSGSERWVARFNGPANSSDRPADIGISPDGSKVYVTGRSTGIFPDIDYATVAYDASTGSELWSTRYGGPGAGVDQPADLSVSPDGTRIYVTGRSDGVETPSTPNSDYATVSYDGDGKQVWVARFSGPGTGVDAGRAVEVSPDGRRVFVTGVSRGTATANDAATVAYVLEEVAPPSPSPSPSGTPSPSVSPSPSASATPTPSPSPSESQAPPEFCPLELHCEEWVARWAERGSSIDEPEAIAVSSDGGRVYVTGGNFRGSVFMDFVTVAYDAATGEELWVSKYNGPGKRGDGPVDIGVSPDGTTVYVAGFSVGRGTGNDFTIVTYDAATGDEVWVARYNGPANGGDRAASLVMDPAGERLYVTGESWGGDPSSGGTHWDYATVAFDAVTGERLWVSRFNGPANDGDVAYEVGLSPSGDRVFVTGWSFGGFPGTYVDYGTVAYDAVTGAELWTARYNGPTDNVDEARALAVDPTGSRVYVTGYSAGEGPPVGGEFGNPDYATVAYDMSTGEQLWAARYQGPGNGGDRATAVGVDPTGERVYVTGFSQQDGPDSPRDYATLGYDAATGKALWTSRFNGVADRADQAHDLGVSPDGTRVYVTGFTDAFGDSYGTLALDSENGSRRWIARLDGGRGSGLALSPDGARVFVTGATRGVFTNLDFTTVSYCLEEPCPPSRPGPSPRPTPSSSPTPLPPPPGERGTFTSSPDDPFFLDQWGPKRIQAPQTWQETRATGFGINVAVIDTGVDIAEIDSDQPHEDLRCIGKLGTGASVIKGKVRFGESADDVNGHGTHVAGIIGACTNNGRGIVGVAPDTRIVPFRVFPDNGDGADTADVAEAIRLATVTGAHVVNLSLSAGAVGYVPSMFEEVEDAISDAVAAGVVVVAAAGNDSLPICEFPALAKKVVCVGALDPRDLKAVYSTFPNKVEGTEPGPGLVAPGGTGTRPLCGVPEENILSLWPKELDLCGENRHGYDDVAGTSMAAPHVAGVAALVYDRLGGQRSASNAQTVIDAIIDNTDDLGTPGYDPIFGFGRINALKAVESVGETDPSPSPSGSPTGSPSTTPTPPPTETGSPSPSASPQPETTTVSFTERSATSGQYSDETRFEASLTDSAGDPIQGAELNFELTGSESSRTFTATTDADGVATVTPTLTEKPGPHQLTVRFAGDEDHAGDADTVSFVVDKEDTALELSVHGEDDDKTLRARLSDLDTSSEGIAQRTIDFYSDGELIASLQTDANGVASVALPRRHRGNNRTYEAVFEGDDFYLGSSDERAGKGKGKGGNGGGSGGNGGGGEGGRTYAGRMLPI